MRKMSTDEFCYWLNGFFERSESNSLSSEEVRMIREHLGLVFEKVTTNTNIQLEMDKYVNMREPDLDFSENPKLRKPNPYIKKLC